MPRTFSKSNVIVMKITERIRDSRNAIKKLIDQLTTLHDTLAQVEGSIKEFEKTMEQYLDARDAQA